MKKPANANPQPMSLKEIAKKQERRIGEVWELRLYVAGQTPRSVAAFANLKKICEEHLAGPIQYRSGRSGEASAVGRRGPDPGNSHPGAEVASPDAQDCG